MKRYTSEQLSRILGEHDAGLLRAGGRHWYAGAATDPHPGGCVNQVAFNIPNPADALLGLAGNSFDLYYEQAWTPERLVDFLAEWT